MSPFLRRLANIPDSTKRYLVVGVTVYIFELAVIYMALGAGASNVLAVGVSYWAGLVVSFILQKFITFQDKRTHHKVVAMQVLAYSLLVLCNFLFTLAFTQIVGHYISAWLCRTFALGITTFWNFYLYKTKIFNHAVKEEKAS